MKNEIFEVKLTEKEKLQGEAALLKWLAHEVKKRWEDKAMNIPTRRKACDALVFLDEYRREENAFRKKSMEGAAREATGALIEVVNTFDAAQAAIDEAKRREQQQKAEELHRAATTYEREIIPRLKELTAMYQSILEAQHRWRTPLVHAGISEALGTIGRLTKSGELTYPLFEQFRKAPDEA